jgi:hypothetical protein
MSEKTLRADQQIIAIGGLMRCCVGTLRTSTAMVEIGDVLPCAYCNSTMTLRPPRPGGDRPVWHWNEE